MIADSDVGAWQK